MRKTMMFLSLLAVLAFAYGCTEPTDTPPADPDASESSDDDAAQNQSEIEAALAALPEEDREAAREQKICPVSGVLLGSMKTPCKVTVKGREVFLCCSGCEGTIKDDPDTYLAKLDE